MNIIALARQINLKHALIKVRWNSLGTEKFGFSRNETTIV